HQKKKALRKDGREPVKEGLKRDKKPSKKALEKNGTLRRRPGKRIENPSEKAFKKDRPFFNHIFHFFLKRSLTQKHRNP
ncbi:MAG: hypothetical protein ACPG7D_09225, partial [Candidatus Puniceispirillaceae bacterium]